MFRVLVVLLSFALVRPALGAVAPCPNVTVSANCPDGVCPQPNGLRDRFGRKPAAPEPSQPQTPTDPPKFDFPGDAPAADAPAAPQADPPARRARMRDWTPEQWEKFFQIVMMIVSAFSGAGVLGGAQVFLRKRAEKAGFDDVAKRVHVLVSAAKRAEEILEKVKSKA